MKTVRKLIAALACIIVMGAFTGCSDSDTSEVSYLDPLIRADIDDDKTVITDIECAVTALDTKEYDKTVGGSRVGYGYIPSQGSMGIGIGVGGSKSVKHVVEYYVTAEDCNGIACRFAIDELDWKKYEVGDPITVQQVTEYTSYGQPYMPYYSFMGKKLTMQVVSDSREEE